jgi:pimeloyl-ACP methyl ester carboxylesterase
MSSNDGIGRLRAIEHQFDGECASVVDRRSLEDTRTRYLSRKAGLLTLELQSLGKLPKEQRAECGRVANEIKVKIETAGYYDVVNFARQLKVPGIYSMGFNDEVCPPTSMYASYNVITAPKELFIVPETGHWTYPEQTEKLTIWLVGKLKGQ